jgi:hypothetical protein
MRAIRIFYSAFALRASAENGAFSVNRLLGLQPADSQQFF